MEEFNDSMSFFPKESLILATGVLQYRATHGGVINAVLKEIHYASFVCQQLCKVGSCTHFCQMMLEKHFSLRMIL